MDKCVSQSIGYNATHPFVDYFPLFLIALDGIHKDASTIDKSPDRKGLEIGLHPNRPDGEIDRTFKDRNTGNDCVVGLEICSNIESGSHYTKRRMSVKPLSAKRSTKFWSRRLNGITAPFSPFCLQFLRLFHKCFRIFWLSPFGVQNTCCSFLDSFCVFGHNVGEVEGV